MPMKLEFEFGTGRASRRRDDSPARVLVLADFLGDTPAHPSRKPVAVDPSELDALIDRWRPSLELASPLFGTPHRISLRALDDFHPDGLIRSVPTLAAMVELRRHLDVPAKREAAAERLRARALELGLDAPAVASESVEAPAETEGSLFASLIGGTPAAHTLEATRAPSIDRFVRSIVGADFVLGPDASHEALVRTADAMIALALREILHHPRMRALEAAWRGLHFVLSRCESAECHVLAATRSDLSEGAFVDTALSHGDEPFSLAVCDIEIAPDDVPLLTTLAERAAERGTTLLAGASPALLSDADVSASFRASPPARHIGLALPRFLMRQPYGKKSDPVESLAFEEVGDSPSNDELLWGNGCFVVTVALLTTSLEVADLPHVVVRGEGSPSMVPCAQALVNDRERDAILARGIMPILSHANRNSVRLARAQSFSEPPISLEV